MGSFARTAGGIAAATLAGATLTAAPSAANAQSAANARRVVIPVPCDSAQLPSAVVQANAAGTATIRLARNCTYLTNATLSFGGGATTPNITLLGGPATAIKADPAAPPGPILNVAAGATLRVQGIFILGGNNTTGTGLGGGIANAGTLTLNFVTITGNTATFVGGVYNTGHAVIAHSVINANTATANVGGIFNGGTMTVFETLVAGNHADGEAGGIGINPGTTTKIVQSTIKNNTAATRGGGIDNFGTTSLDRTLVQENKASLTNPNSGGGIFTQATGTITLKRSIIRRNSPNNCTPAIPHCLG
jgi:hypothetical protein